VLVLIGCCLARAIRCPIHAFLQAQFTCSANSFNSTSLDRFFAAIAEPGTASWLDGVQLGKEEPLPLKAFIARVHAANPRFTVSRVPDVTHTVLTGFAIPEWDYAWSATHGREAINPSPKRFEQIIRLRANGSYPTAGYIAYSEGLNDDFNKCLWSALTMEPSLTAEDLARQYARTFFGAENEVAATAGDRLRPTVLPVLPPSRRAALPDDSCQPALFCRAHVAASDGEPLPGVRRPLNHPLTRPITHPDRIVSPRKGLLGLEQNWVGPAVRNGGAVAATLAAWDRVAARAPPGVENWRLDMHRYRATVDAYVQLRLLFETAAEAAARKVLSTAGRGGADRAITAAAQILANASSFGTSTARGGQLKRQCYALRDAINNSAALCPSCGGGRGGTSTVSSQADTLNLQNIDAPLSSAPWLLAQIKAIAVTMEAAIDPPGSKVAQIDALLSPYWPVTAGEFTPGSFYDWVGSADPSDRPHLLPGPGATADPQHFYTPLHSNSGCAATDFDIDFDPASLLSP